MQNKVSDNEKSSNKGSGYSAVLLCQILTSAVLFILFSFFVGTSDAFSEIAEDLIKSEVFTLYDITAFAQKSLSAFFGDNEAPSQSRSFSSEGMGGDDIELYKAQGNTSFAPFKTTCNALKPIENGRYTSYFGYRINPITGDFSFHTGLDIAAAEGTKIRAAYGGRVTKTGTDQRAGNYVIITHQGGFETFYCHCSEILAEKGAVVRQGETVALVGSTGWSTGPHLHFEVRKASVRYNPLYILEK